MKKKGFTLIELLAVIVILAVIALIAVPQILKVLSKSRRAAAGVLYYARHSGGGAGYATFRISLAF